MVSWLVPAPPRLRAARPCALTKAQCFFLSPARLTMHWGCVPFFVSAIAKICITGNHLETGSEDGKARLR